MSTPGTFAFTVHPRARLSEDLARAWRPLGRVPNPVYDSALRHLSLPPVAIAGIHIGGEQVGHVVLVPSGLGTCSPFRASSGAGTTSA